MTTVSRVDGTKPLFRVQSSDGAPTARRVLLATGVADDLPELKGIERFYGTSVHHCQYCDGWEHRDQVLAAFGVGRHAVGLALSLKTWSRDVVVCTGGPSKLRPQDRDELKRFSIPLYTSPVATLEGEGGDLRRIVFENGEAVECQAMFFNTGSRQVCELGRDLKCIFTHKGTIKTDKVESTSVPGIFAVGDCSRNVQMVSVAAAEGTIAAQAMNIELEGEDRAHI